MNHLKYKLLLIGLLFSIATATATPRTISQQTNLSVYSNFKDSISVYIFLHETCVISQFYTLPLRSLHETYANDSLQFVGIFPSFSSKKQQIAAFKKKYQLQFRLKTDYYKTKTKLLGATVTPEVVIYNEDQQTILYKGRIDDTYFRIGKKRRVTTTSELQDALTAIVNNEPILVKETEAIGCFINQRALGN